MGHLSKQREYTLELSTKYGKLNSSLLTQKRWCLLKTYIAISCSLRSHLPFSVAFDTRTHQLRRKGLQGRPLSGSRKVVGDVERPMVGDEMYKHTSSRQLGTSAQGLPVHGELLPPLAPCGAVSQTDPRWHSEAHHDSNYQGSDWRQRGCCLVLSSREQYQALPWTMHRTQPCLCRPENCAALCHASPSRSLSNLSHPIPAHLKSLIMTLSMKYSILVHAASAALTARSANCYARGCQQGTLVPCPYRSTLAEHRSATVGVRGIDPAQVGAVGRAAVHAGRIDQR